MQQEPSTKAKPSEKASRGRRFRLNLKILGPLLGLIALFIVGTLVNPVFLSPTNLFNVLTRSSFIGIIAIGATFVIIAGGIDLSVGSMTALIAGIMIIAMNYAVTFLGVNWLTILVGIVVSIILGFAAGFLNGLTITRGKIAAFIVTLGTLGIFRSLVTYLANGGTLSLGFELRRVYGPVYSGSLLGVPYPVLLFAAVAILATLILRKTRFGRYCFAIGSNETVARYSAINVDRVTTMTYVLQALCVSVATIIYVPRLGSASASTGILWELEAIAAVIIGGTALKGGSGNIWGTVIGAIMLSTIGNVLNLTGYISEYLNGAVQGIIIIVAVLLQRGEGSSD